MEFTVLYTHQKTKKSKKWQDGKLRVSNYGRVVLMNDSGSQVETVYVKADQIKVGEEIESDRHLITIEEETKDPNDCNQGLHGEPLRSGSDDGHQHKTQRIPLMSRNPLRRKRMGFTVPRPLNQQPSLEVSKENISDSISHRGVNFKGSNGTRYNTPLPATGFPPSHLHNSENSSQKPSVWFNVLGKDNLNEQKAGEVIGRDFQQDPTFSEVQRVPSSSATSAVQIQRSVNKVSTSNSYMQPNEENVHSNDNESHKSVGKRSASQILALLGKRKHSFQPPLKKAKVGTEKTKMGSDFNVGSKKFNPEPEGMSIQGERLDGARHEHQLESEELSGSIDDDREKILEGNLQGTLALHAALLNKAGETSLNSTLQSNNCTQELKQKIGFDNGCKTTGLPEISVKNTYNRNHELVNKVSHMQRSCAGKDLNSYGIGVACIHRTRDGEDCGNLEIRVSEDGDVNKKNSTGSCSIVTEEHSVGAVRDVIYTKNLEELQRTREQKEHAVKDDSEEHDKIKVKIGANEKCTGIIRMITGGENVWSVEPSDGASTATAMDMTYTLSEEHDTQNDGEGCGIADGEISLTRQCSDINQMAEDLDRRSNQISNDLNRGVSESGDDADRILQSIDQDGSNVNKGRERDGGNCRGGSSKEVASGYHHSWIVQEDSLPRIIDDDIEKGLPDPGDTEVLQQLTVAKLCKGELSLDSVVNETETFKTVGPGAMLVSVDSLSHQSTTLSDEAVEGVNIPAESTTQPSQNTLSDDFSSEPADKVSKMDLITINKDRRLEENKPPKELGGLTLDMKGNPLCLKSVRIERDHHTNCNFTSTGNQEHGIKSNIIGQSEDHDSATSIIFEEDGNDVTLEEDDTDETTVTERRDKVINVNIHEMHQLSLTTFTCDKENSTYKGDISTSVLDEKFMMEMSGSCELTEVEQKEEQKHNKKAVKGSLESQRGSVPVLITSSESQNISAEQPQIGSTTTETNKENLMMRYLDQQMPGNYASSSETADNGFAHRFHSINHNSVKIAGNETKESISSDSNMIVEPWLKDSTKRSDKVVAGCTQEAVNTKDEINIDHPSSEDSLVGDHHIQDKHDLPPESEDAVTPPCLHSKSLNEMEKYKGKVDAESGKIGSKVEYSDMFITNKREANMPLSAEHCGDSPLGSVAQGGIQSSNMIDSSSDLTNNYSQNSLLSLTSIDTLDYSLPSSLPEQLHPLTSMGGSSPPQNTSGVTHGSCLVDSGSDFITSPSNKKGTFFRNAGNCPPGCNRVTLINDDISQEFLNDVAEIFEKSRIHNRPDGMESINSTDGKPDGVESINSTVHKSDDVESIVKLDRSVDEISPSLSNLIFGEMKHEEDGPLPLRVSPTSSMTNSEVLKGEEAEIEMMTDGPHVSTMIHLHHLEEGSVSENDPFSFPSLHASNILTHPSELQSPGVSSGRGDVTKPSQTSKLHSRSQLRSHYWRQPLASSLVRRRPPSPTVIHASSFRDDLLQQESLSSLLQNIHPLNTPTEPEKFDDFVVNVSCGSFLDNSGTAFDENRRFDFHGRDDTRDWKGLSLSKPVRDFQNPGNSPNHGTFMNLDQLQCMTLSSEDRIPGVEEDHTDQWGDELMQLVTRDCSPLKSTNFFHGGVEADKSDSNVDTVFHDNNGTLHNHHMVDELLDYTAAGNRGWFVEAGIPDCNSSQTPVLDSSKISATFHQKEMSPVHKNDSTKISCYSVYHSELEHSVPSVSQETLTSVTETPFQDESPVKMLCQPASYLCTPQCVPPSASPVISIKDKPSIHAENQLDTQSENLKWLEGSSPINSQRSRFVPHSPIVAGVDMFMIDAGSMLVDSDEGRSEQTVPLLDCSETGEWKEQPSNVSRPSESPHTLLHEPFTKASSSSRPFHQIQSSNDSIHEETDTSKASMQSKPNISDSTASSQTTQSKRLLKTPIVAMVTEDYSSTQLFEDCRSFESSQNVHSAEKQSENERKRSSFNLPEPYRDGLNNKFMTYHAQDPYEDSKQPSERRHPLPQFQSSEPQQHKYKNILEDTSRSNSQRVSIENNSTSEKQDRYPASVPSQTRTGSFQTPLIREQSQVKGHSLGKITTNAEIGFPCLKDVSAASIPQRQIKIPTSFSEAVSYKQVLTAVLKEHLNIILYEVAYNFFSALSKVDVSSYSPLSNNETTNVENPVCQHKQPSKRICVKKDGPNKGRFFFTCSKPRGSQCKFFQWADQGSKKSSNGEPSRSSREVLNDSKSIEMYLKSFGVSLYCECQLLRKSPFADQLAGAPTWIKKYRKNKVNSEKKKLYLKISRRENSSVYGKDDLWVISRDLTFDSSNSFLAKSVFHGPNNAGEVEIEPLSGYSPSNWTGEVTVHALHAYNASTELTCLNNIQEFVNPRTLPILPALLKRYSSDPSLSANVHPTSFKSPVISSSCNKNLSCSRQQIVSLNPTTKMELADDVIQQYHLNEDQAKALLGVAGMFMDSDDERDKSSVCLIHGVFGAGKSYLLAITVLFLCQIFQLHQANGGKPDEWKILISSTTNVAVDRILLSLLQLGFEEFIRVGSIRKIAKPVLPYSVHASGKETQELKELQQMLRGDLSNKEKSFVRKTIEKQRLGINQKMLSKVLVVGVTCAACSFPCVANLKFPVVLLDECSQITEPACLLPVARFECQKLVLVGDPKQLDPTIQGSEPAHKFNLEQTLFDRLMLLGYKPTMLRTQYRCHPRISGLANELFYEKKLVNGVDELERKELVDGFPTLCFYNVANGKECPATGGSFLNDKEATFVVTMLEVLLLNGIEPSQVGIITLYKAQVFHISTLLLQSRLVGLRDLKAIQISTVDAFQGGEKDVIILSCVRSDFMGFAASDKRTNVALTRSKYHLLIVGNQRILSANSLWNKVILKCKECRNGIQDSSSLLKEWTPHLDKVMLEEKTKKKKSKRGPKKMKETDITSEPDCITAGSPPISLDSQDDNGESTGTDVTFPSTHLTTKEDNPQHICSIVPSHIDLCPIITKAEINQSADTASNETNFLKLGKNNSLTYFDFESDTNVTAKESMNLDDECDQLLFQIPSSNCLKVAPDQSRVQSESVDSEKAKLSNSDSNKNQRESDGATIVGTSLLESSEDEEMQRTTSIKKILRAELPPSPPMERSTACEENDTASEENNTASEERNATKMQNYSPSYSPLEEVVESSEDELPNFDLETDLLF